MTSESQPNQGTNQAAVDRGEPEKRALAKSVGVIFFDTQDAALDKIDTLKNYAQQADQLNIVIKEECKSINSELDKAGRVYCGSVWWQVHERRLKEGWYNKEHIYGTTQSQKI